MASKNTASNSNKNQHQPNRTNKSQQEILNTSTLSWTTLKPMPTKRAYTSLTICNGKLYAIGGCDSVGKSIDSFECYDFSTKKWSGLSCMQVKRASPGVSSVGKYVVVIGGIGIDQNAVDSVEVYDTEEKDWIKKQPLKDRLLGMTCTVRENKLITAGGMSIDTNPKDYLMEYDIETDRWKALPPLPTARYAATSFIINDNLYVIGGRQGKIPITAFEVFNFSSNSWKKLPDIPSKRVFPSYAHSNSHIFSLGGLKENALDGFEDCLEIFDIDKEIWTLGPPMKTKRGDFFSCFFGNKLIAAGGLGNEGKPLDLVESYDHASMMWSQMSPMTLSLCSSSYIKHVQIDEQQELGTSIIKEHFYVLGGISLLGITNACLVLSLDDK